MLKFVKKKYENFINRCIAKWNIEKVDSILQKSTCISAIIIAVFSVLASLKIWFVYFIIITGIIEFFIINLFFKIRAGIDRNKEFELKKLREKIDSQKEDIQLNISKIEKLEYEKTYFRSLASYLRTFINHIIDAYEKDDFQEVFENLLVSLRETAIAYLETDYGYGINIYFYDRSKKTIRRIKTWYNCQGVDEPSTGEAYAITDINIKNKYYKKVILGNRKKVFLCNNEEILSKFSVEDQADIAEFNQYIGRKYICGKAIIYIEMISFRENVFSKSKKNDEIREKLKSVENHVIAPFAGCVSRMVFDDEDSE